MGQTSYVDPFHLLYFLMFYAHLLYQMLLFYLNLIHHFHQQMLYDNLLTYQYQQQADQSSKMIDQLIQVYLQELLDSIYFHIFNMQDQMMEYNIFA